MASELGRQLRDGGISCSLYSCDSTLEAYISTFVNTNFTKDSQPPCISWTFVWWQDLHSGSGCENLPFLRLAGGSLSPGVDVSGVVETEAGEEVIDCGVGVDIGTGELAVGTCVCGERSGWLPPKDAVAEYVVAGVAVTTAAGNGGCAGRMG